VFPGNTHDRTGRPSRVKVDRLLYLRLLHQQEVHCTVETVQVQVLPLRQEDLLLEPLLVTVQFGVGRKCVVDDLGDGAPLLLVPLVLGELVVTGDGAVGVVPLGLS
jgi:hypothetical protein